MQHNINSLLGYKMAATDGMIGEVDDFYFDDGDWVIRYIILKTGNWLSGRKVLISPVALIKIFWKTGLFPVNVSKQQIRDSPDIDLEKPVSRQREVELCQYYNWESNWGIGFFGGGALYFVDSYLVTDEDVNKETAKMTKRPGEDIHLRSIKELTGYNIHTTDGAIGHLSDFIIDDKDWELKFIVAGTDNWFGRKKVLIDIKHLEKIDWENTQVFLDVTRASIEKCKLFDEQQFSTLETDDNITINAPLISNKIR